MAHLRFTKNIAVNILAITGGRVRTKVEFRVLLNAADDKLMRIIPTMAPQGALETSENRADRPNLWRYDVTRDYP